MKVELEKIRLAVTAMQNEVVVGIPNKAGSMMLHKHNITSDFLKCIVDYGKNTRFNISIEGKKGKKCQVCVKELTDYKNELFTRKEVVKLLGRFISDGVGKDVPYDEWIKNNLK